VALFLPKEKELIDKTQRNEKIGSKMLFVANVVLFFAGSTLLLLNFSDCIIDERQKSLRWNLTN
jgi:hypothetical protein